MDIKGDKILFTPSEAEWAQDESMRATGMHELTQKILDARIEYTRPWLEIYLAPSVSAATNDLIARIALSDLSDDLHDEAMKHAINLDGEEQNVIAIQLTDQEKQRLLLLAEIENEKARIQLETPEITEIENKMNRDDFAMYVATSDIIKPDQASELINIINDPEYSAFHRALEDEKAARIVRLTSPIIAALKNLLDK